MSDDIIARWRDDLYECLQAMKQARRDLAADAEKLRQKLRRERREDEREYLMETGKPAPRETDHDMRLREHEIQTKEEQFEATWMPGLDSAARLLADEVRVAYSRFLTTNGGDRTIAIELAVQDVLGSAPVNGDMVVDIVRDTAADDSDEVWQIVSTGITAWVRQEMDAATSDE